MSFVRREYQNVALAAVRQIRQIVLYWTRRGRKSTTLGDIMFDDLSRGPGRMAVAASASLLLGSELVTVTVSAGERALCIGGEVDALNASLAAGADAKGLLLQPADQQTGKVVKGLSREEYADMYQANRLEWRLYFDKTAYSRLQVIAPNPATARGWRALVVRDEVGYTRPAFERDMQIATDAMMRDTPDLKMVYASNLCMDDRHPYFAMTMPRDITAASEEEQFPANPRGHLYIGQTGLTVHRVALKDAYAAGHRLYDDFGNAMTYEQARNFGPVKMGWDISYALNHKAGGASAIDVIQLTMAQQRGADLGCVFAFVESDAEFRAALAQLRERIGPGRVGVGMDVASTEKETSNPTSVTVLEDTGGEYPARLVIYWKDRREAEQRERLRAILDAIAGRPAGGEARMLCIDGTSERLFADGTMQMFKHRLPVVVVVSSESVDPVPAGYETTGVNYKTWLGDLFSQALNTGRVPVPPSTYLKDDYRLVMKDGGRYVCSPEPDGKHGDGFDSGKLALWALMRQASAGFFVPIPFRGPAADVIAARRQRTVLA